MSAQAVPSTTLKRRQAPKLPEDEAQVRCKRRRVDVAVSNVCMVDSKCDQATPSQFVAEAVPPMLNIANLGTTSPPLSQDAETPKFSLAKAVSKCHQSGAGALPTDAFISTFDEVPLTQVARALGNAM